LENGEDTRTPSGADRVERRQTEPSPDARFRRLVPGGWRANPYVCPRSRPCGSPGRSGRLAGEVREKPITLNDIVITTPYNAQISEIQHPPGACIGTVDKF